MNFLTISGELLKNTTLRADDKLILSYIYNLKKAGKTFFGSTEYLSKELGMKKSNLEKRFETMEKFGLLKKTGNGITLQPDWDDVINFAIHEANVAVLDRLAIAIAGKFTTEKATPNNFVY